jgi:hypothetical protein
MTEEAAARATVQEDAVSEGDIDAATEVEVEWEVERRAEVTCQLRRFE